MIEIAHYVFFHLNFQQFNKLSVYAAVLYTMTGEGDFCIDPSSKMKKVTDGKSNCRLHFGQVSFAPFEARV
jgi:hypothetical protein